MASPHESITKNIFNISDHLLMRVRVVLGTKNYKGGRKRFLNEFEYKTNKYSDVPSVTSVSANTTDYLIIETQQTWEEKQNSGFSSEFKSFQMIFSYDNMCQLQWMVSNAYNWIVDPKALCVYENGMISHIKSNCQNLVASCESKFGGVSGGYTCGVMKMTPTIRTESDQTRNLAILVTMGSDNRQIDALTINQMASLLYFLERFDLCNTSISLTNQVLLATPFLRKT